MNKPVIFISHIHEDREIATCLKKFIDEIFLGMFNIFVSSDGASIRSGDNWSSSIEKALRQAELVIAVITPDAVDRRWIFFECGGAYFSNKSVIPVCCRKMQLSKLGTPLSWLQSIDGSDVSSVNNLISDIATKFDLRLPSMNVSELINCLQKEVYDSADIVKKHDLVKAQYSLPIFFIIDTSASMYGQPINALTQALKQLMDELLQNTISDIIPIVSVVSFGSGAEEIVPPTPLSSDVMEFQFEPGGTSDLGAALEIVAKRLKNPNWLSANYINPMIFLITDGQPTDDWRLGLKKLEQSSLGVSATKIAIGIGSSPDFSFLKEIPDYP